MKNGEKSTREEIYYFWSSSLLHTVMMCDLTFSGVKEYLRSWRSILHRKNDCSTSTVGAYLNEQMSLTANSGNAEDLWYPCNSECTCAMVWKPVLPRRTSQYFTVIEIALEPIAEPMPFLNSYENKKRFYAFMAFCLRLLALVIIIQRIAHQQKRGTWTHQGGRLSNISRQLQVNHFTFSLEQQV